VAKFSFQEKIQHGRLWVTADKADNILDYPPAERTLLVNGLTHILATVPHFLTLWLNISTPDPQMAEEVKQVCGSQFWKLCDLESHAPLRSTQHASHFSPEVFGNLQSVKPVVTGNHSIVQVESAKRISLHHAMRQCQSHHSPGRNRHGEWWD